MFDAVAEHPTSGQLALDFYDRQRLATWVRDHPGLVPWMRAKAGRPIQGWQSHGDWSCSGADSEAAFLWDDKVCLHDGTALGARTTETGSSVIDGLQQVRAALSIPGRSVRLVGLSGVGKTRFAEALFEDRVGSAAIPASQALYTDLALQPEPTPAAMATHLVQAGVLCVLVVDNCPPELHRQLTQVCGTTGSDVRLLTIEYDIREDQPEATDVFRLEAASPELVGKIVLERFSSVSPVDADTIGRFSGGNARVGLALANTLQRGDSLAGLSDEDLFLRLFRQRHGEVTGLLASAEACALVYFFDGETFDGDEAELPLLAELAGCSPREMYRQVAELRRRELLQARSRWRAILPHAIANRLAKRALESLPAAEIEKCLVVAAPGRLLQSFSRRLGYLHESAAAVQIVERWLSESGLLADISRLDPIRLAILRNVAPVSPRAVLTAIERAGQGEGASDFFSTQNRDRAEFARLLRKLAYQPALFDRSIELLARFAEVEGNDHRHDSVTNLFRSLFSPFLSGTHAPVEQRMRAAGSLLRSGTVRRQELGTAAVGVALETFHFSSDHDFDFGARSRDYGYQPRTVKEQSHWFSAAIRLAIGLGASDAASARAVRKVLAAKLPGLWVRTTTQDLLEEAARSFSAIEFWADGWVAVREALWRNGAQPDTGGRARLQALEQVVAPSTLLEQVQLHVLHDGHWHLNAGETAEATAEAMKRADKLAEELGERTATEPDLLQTLLPGLLAEGEGRRMQFGRGLARGASEKGAVWRQMVEPACNPEGIANQAALIGFLQAWREVDPESVHSALDEAVTNPALAHQFPYLQVATAVDGSSLTRLHRSLSAGLAPVHMFGVLRFGRSSDAIRAGDLKHLLEAIAAVPSGLAVAIGILTMRFRSEFGDEAERLELVVLGRELLSRVDPTSSAHRNLDFELASLVAACLGGPDAETAASALCSTIVGALIERRLSLHNFHRLIPALFKAQPAIALAIFLVENGTSLRRFRILSVLDHDAKYIRHPLTDVADADVLAWCERNPAVHFQAAASIVPLSKVDANGAGLIWTELAVEVLRRAPDKHLVLKRYTERLYPNSWSGSRAAILETNAKLLENIGVVVDVELAEFARLERDRILAESRREREVETHQSRLTDERFE